MGFLEFFRRPPPVRTRDDLADFIDRNAAFVVQKGLYEYSRARAGHYAKVLFVDPAFQRAAEEARWRAYPLGLAMVGEMAEGILRPHANQQGGGDHFQPMVELILSVFDRYPVPPSMSARAWNEARRELEHRLQLIALHPPKRAMDIPEVFAKPYFELMPIHEKLRGRDFPTIHNFLKVTLCNIHDELIKRGDPASLAAQLRAAPGSQA